MLAEYTSYEKTVVAALAIDSVLAWVNTLALEYVHPEIRLYDVISTAAFYVAIFGTFIWVVLMIRKFYQLELLRKSGPTKTSV